MKKRMGMGALALLLLSGCAMIFGDPAPVKAFKAFKRWSRLGNCSELRALVKPESQAAQWVEDYCTPGGGMTVYGRTIAGKSAADLAADMGPSALSHRSSLKLASKQKQKDGSVSLVLVEKDLTRSNFSRPAPDRTYRLRLEELGGAWKLVEYSYEDAPEAPAQP
jgi:hypothetical protein